MSEKDWNARLAYTKLSDGKERTKFPVICDRRICHGYIEENYWCIMDVAKDKRIDEGLSRDNEEAKRHLKKALIALGAHFTNEVRATKDSPIRMLTEEVIHGIIKEKGIEDEN